MTAGILEAAASGRVRHLYSAPARLRLNQWAVAGDWTVERQAIAVADGRDPNDIRISDLPTRQPITVPPEETAAAAANLMVSSRIRHLPVVEDGRLIGMVDIVDACRGLIASD